MELSKIRFSKFILKLWIAIVVLLFILQQNVFGLICRNILVKSGTLNRILGTLKNDIFEIYLKTLKCYIVFWLLILEQNVIGLICRNIWVESRTINGTLKNEILKFFWKLWSATVFWILILEHNVLGLICSTIGVESRTLNRTFKTLQNDTLKKIVDILISYIFRDRIFYALKGQNIFEHLSGTLGLLIMKSELS